jgi:hypothetical protein
MTNSWQDFTESEKQYPEEIAKAKIEGFSTATKGLAELLISELSDQGRLRSSLNTDFSFRITLVSPLLPQYRFKIMEFGYGVNMDPVKYILEAGIDGELFGADWSLDREKQISNSEFINTLSLVFASKTFIDLVSGLMKVAQKKTKEL